MPPRRRLGSPGRSCNRPLGAPSRCACSRDSSTAPRVQFRDAAQPLHRPALEMALLLRARQAWPRDRVICSLPALVRLDCLSMGGGSSTRIAYLDGLRGIAALIVVFSHITETIAPAMF